MARRTSVRVNLDPSAIANLLAVTTDASASRAAGRVRDRAKSFAPVRTGKLRDSITSRKARTPSHAKPEAVYEIGSNVPYAGYQERGTGPILARPGGVLRFKPKGSGMFVFARRTSGVPAVHYLRRAYRSVTLADYLK